MRGESTIGAYTLTFDFNALCLAEEHCGPLGEAMAEMGRGSLKTIRALFWAGLQRKHAMSIEEAGEAIQELGVEDASNAIAKGVESAFAKVGGKGNGKAARS